MIDAPEKYPQHVIIKRFSLTCSYCGDVMRFTNARVKRPVPPGAKDLGLYDQQHYWQCGRCHATSKECLLNCECGELTIDFPAFDRRTGNRELPPQRIVESDERGLYGYLCTYQNNDEDIWGYDCISCVRCRQCGEQLRSNKFFSTGQFSDYNKSEAQWNFYHEQCFPLRQRAQELKQQEAERRERRELQQAWRAERKKEAVRGVLKSLLWASIAYLIVGFIGCSVRGGPPSYTYNPNYGKGSPGLDAFSTEGVYAALLIVGIAVTWGLVGLIRIHAVFRLLLFVLGLATLVYCGKATVDAMNLPAAFARTFGINRSDVPADVVGGTQGVWTMRRVNARMNIHSSPDSNSSIVSRRKKNSRIAVTGEPVRAGDVFWVRVSTDDGKIQGWANLKFLSTSPQLQEPNAPSSNEESEANNQGGEVPEQKSDNVTVGNSLNNSSKLSREKCQELIDRSFRELAVEIPPECTKQLEDHYKQLREKHNGKNGRQKEW